MKRLLITALALVLAVASAARAQTIPDQKVQVLVLPLTVDFEDPDGFNGLTTAGLIQDLRQKAQQAWPDVELVFPSADDPRLQGLDLSVEPDPAQAVAVANRFGVPLVGWTKVNFRLEHRWSQTDSSVALEQSARSGDPAPQNVVSVGGLAHLGVIDARTGRVLSQGPVMVFRSQLTRATPGTDSFEETVHAVTQQCAQDLAGQIVEVAGRRSGGR